MSEGGEVLVNLWEHHLYHLTGHMLSWQCSNRCVVSEGGRGFGLWEHHLYHLTGHVVLAVF